MSDFKTGDVVVFECDDLKAIGRICHIGHYAYSIDVLSVVSYSGYCEWTGHNCNGEVKSGNGWRVGTRNNSVSLLI